MTLSHTDVLNEIIAHDCPSRFFREDGSEITNLNEEPDFDHAEFEFELHCVVAKVKARLISTFQTIQYEILDISFE